MKEEILEGLTNATDEIFLEWQAKLHVTSGDISPSDCIALENQLEHLTETMISILEKQPKLKISHVWLDNRSYDAKELAKDYETFQALRTIQEKIEKGVANEEN